MRRELAATTLLLSALALGLPACDRLGGAPEGKPAPAPAGGGAAGGEAGARPAAGKASPATAAEKGGATAAGAAGKAVTGRTPPARPETAGKVQTEAQAAGSRRREAESAVVREPELERAGREANRGRARRGDDDGASGDLPRRQRIDRRGDTVNLERAARLGAETVPAGRYQVRIESTAQGDAVTLVRDGKTVAKELAVKPPKQPRHPGDGAWLWVDRRDESMYRIYAQRGRDLVFIVLEIG